MNRFWLSLFTFLMHRAAVNCMIFFFFVCFERVSLPLAVLEFPVETRLALNSEISLTVPSLMVY